MAEDGSIHREDEAGELEEKEGSPVRRPSPEGCCAPLRHLKEPLTGKLLPPWLDERTATLL